MIGGLGGIFYINCDSVSSYLLYQVRTIKAPQRDRLSVEPDLHLVPAHWDYSDYGMLR